MSRTNELLEAAAERFAMGSNPFCTGWLSEHNVTIDECDTLSQNIANACKNWARLKGDALMEAVVRASTDDPAERANYLAIAKHTESMRRVKRRLG